jgi:hypothetical protein
LHFLLVAKISVINPQRILFEASEQSNAIYWWGNAFFLSRTTKTEYTALCHWLSRGMLFRFSFCCRQKLGKP